MKKQVIVIHGGDTFDTYEDWLSYLKVKKLDFERIKNPFSGWKETLGEKLGDEFELVYPQMPNKQNAKYAEWKIWFETIIPYLEPEVIFIGHSLGGIFLAKYLSENKFPKKIKAIFLVAACYDDETVGSLADFKIPENLEGLRKQGGRIFIYHSEDDPIVPITDAKKYKQALPDAKLTIFKDRGHFMQEEFSELVEDIKNL